MRIISGIHKGRRLIAPKKLPVRPTTDRAKEALFNILQHEFDFHSIQVLDLFAGTGSISYEFASRGVQKILAVDQNPHCIRFIDQTAKQLQMPIDTHQMSVENFIEKHGFQYDLVFMDPPYAFDEENYKALIEPIFQNNIAENGWLIVEHDTHHSFENHPYFDQERKYGSCMFSLFKKKAGR